MADRQEHVSKMGKNPPQLSDEHAQRLTEAYDEFERLVAQGHAFEAHDFVQKIVGKTMMAAATSHLAGLRTAKRRAAAAAQGFKVGM